MRNYKVCIDYKKGPSFSVEVEADSVSQAKLDAKELAKLSGFNDPIKATTIKWVMV